MFYFQGFRFNKFNIAVKKYKFNYTLVSEKCFFLSLSQIQFQKQRARERERGVESYVGVAVAVAAEIVYLR